MADNPLKGGGDDAPEPDPAASEEKPKRTRRAAKKAEEPKATGRKTASYAVLEKLNVSELADDFDGDVYVELGEFDGFNGDKAVDAYLDTEPDIDEGTFVPVPVRHFKPQTVGQEPQPPKRVRK